MILYGIIGGSKTINIRIIQSGSNAQGKGGIPEAMACRMHFSGRLGPHFGGTLSWRSQ